MVQGYVASDHGWLWNCLDRVVPEGMSQVFRRLEVGNHKRRTLNRDPAIFWHFLLPSFKQTVAQVHQGQFSNLHRTAHKTPGMTCWGSRMWPLALLFSQTTTPTHLHFLDPTSPYVTSSVIGDIYLWRHHLWHQDCLWRSLVYIYMYMHTHIHTYLYICIHSLSLK